MEDFQRQIHQQQELMKANIYNSFKESFNLIKAKITNKVELPLHDVAKKLYIVRHGYTIQDKNDLNSGQDESKLIPEGIKAANLAAIKLKKAGISKIYSSEIIRAKQTADIIKKRTGVKIVYDKGLDAWDIGDYEGTSKDEFDEEYYIKHPDEVIKDGESFNQFKNRIIKAYNDIIDKDEDNIAILTHSKNMRLWRAMSKNKDWNKKAIKYFLDSEIANAEVEVIEPKEKNNFDEIQKAKIEVPKGHEAGMKVPKGGSSCANCKFLSEDRKNCKNKYFIKWNDNSSKLPFPADEYCSDWYEPKEKE